MTSKRGNCENNVCSPSKKFKSNIFKEVCSYVSQTAYFNYIDRLKILDLCECSDENDCKHVSKTRLKTINDKIQVLPAIASNFIFIEISGSCWHDALDAIFLSITPKQYLTAKILSHIVDIMLNAHDDKYSKYTVAHLIARCEQTLAFHFRMHPPCFNHEQIITVYKDFLTVETGKINKRYSNRNDYEWKKGIIRYCFNRLHYEVSPESMDGPLIDKDKIVREDLDSSQRLHFEREELELFELLERSERIERLMAVLRSLVELLQFNLLILKSRGTRLRSLMQEVFQEDPQVIGSEFNKITNLHKQIMKMFAYFIHLDYPEEHIDTMTIWLNTVAEFQYYNDDLNRDYPYIRKDTHKFAEEFYSIISDFPHTSILKILKRIQPNYIKFQVGLDYITSALKYNDTSIKNVVLHFFNNSLWNNFPKSDDDANLLVIPEETNELLDDIVAHLSKICTTAPKIETKEMTMYKKFHSSSDTEITRNIIVSAVYITLDAYMKAYDFKKVSKILKQLKTSESDMKRNNFEKSHSYQLTNLKPYEDMNELLDQLKSILNNLRQNDNLPKEVQVFENILI